MALALICVDPTRIASTLDGAAATLAPAFAWVILHVVDTRPVEEWSEMTGRLAGRGPARDRAAARIQGATAREEDDARATIDAWLAAHGRAAEVLQTTGHPEREIVGVALERGVDLIVLGAGDGAHRPRPGKPPRPPKPPPDHPPPHPFGPPRPPGPVARFVIDHAPIDVLLLRDRDATR
ncbi:MAG TPA: universal stress protein [Thermomicrobiales bacterium]|nr:universal stress protein [Thermomicrobiales bacterium]